MKCTDPDAVGKIISEEGPVETENTVYEIGERQTERGVSYPQIVYNKFPVFELPGL